MNVKIGIIGGTGMNSPEIFIESKEIKVTTAFGETSDVLKEGHISGVSCVLLARHGSKHTIMPTNVNYRANLLALKNLGCTHVLVSTACGSLNEKIKPGDMVIIDQFIDRTTKRAATFYDGTVDSFSGILHLPMDRPFCPRTSEILYQSCLALEFSAHPNGTMVTIEGPRFSTRAESKIFRQWGGDVINMTTVPEVVLARELGLCYAAVAMATDYDCWKDDVDVVSVSKVMETMKSNAEKATKILQKAVQIIAEQEWTETIKDMKENVEKNLMPSH